MKRVAMFVAAAVVTWSGVALAQDAVKTDPAHYKVVLDNAAIRILRISYPVGAKGLAHSHPDAMIVALSASKTRFTLADGKTQDSDLAAESGLYTPAGVHTPANIGTTPVDALAIEFKTPAPGKATLPASRPGMAMKILAESPRAMAYRTTADPTFSEPVGSKHDYDQVVIALSAGQMSLSLNGQPAKTTWTRGEAVFIPRGTPHESKNLAGKPIDFIIVAIR